MHMKKKANSPSRHKYVLAGLIFLCLLTGMAFVQGCIDKQPAQTTENDYPITPVPFTMVQIQDDFWQARIETNRAVTVPYTFQKSEETGRISNFAKAAGMEEGEFEGIYFNDSDVFKIIEGASYSLQVNPDPELKEYLDDVIAKIAAAQEEDGYLYTNRTINPAKAADGGGEQRWTNLKVHHELYNVGHMYEAAAAHYQATGERSLLDVAIKNADLVASVFGPGKNMGVPGHQEIEIGLVKLYRVTGEEKYLDLAKFFVDQRGNAEGHELYGKYCQDHMPLAEQETAVGHAVRAGYYYAGATDVAAITGTKDYDEALRRIWEDITYRKIYLTGGVGAERQHEGFGPEYELPNATAYTETCAAIALMLWNHRLFLLHGDVKYMDVFERTLYNGFLSGVSFEGNTFFYPNPLETDGVNEFNQGVCGRSPWFDCSCCPVNVVRIIASVPGYIYATRDEDVYVNLFIGNRAEIDVNGRQLEIQQKTNYPWDGRVEIAINNPEAVPAQFNIRVPGWLRNEVLPGDLYRYTDNMELGVKLTVNGEDEKVNITDGYIRPLKQEWKQGDKIEVVFDMAVRTVESHENVAANQGKMALERGPIVFCAEAADNPDGVLDLNIEESGSFEYTFDEQLLNGVGKIMGKAETDAGTTSFTAIPYYAWAHRQIGEMAVWLNK
jgi:DUF1680 family protein